MTNAQYIKEEKVYESERETSQKKLGGGNHSQLQPHHPLVPQYSSSNQSTGTEHQALSPMTTSQVVVPIQFARSVIRTTQGSVWSAVVVVLDLESQVTDEGLPRGLSEEQIYSSAD